MKSEYLLLKKTEINSNCPECYATDGLSLSFKQEKISSRFVSNYKNQIIERMYCTKCETDIFPGRYTDDIQRVYDYHKKTITPQPSNIRLSTISYCMIGIGVLIIAGLVSLVIL